MNNHRLADIIDQIPTFQPDIVTITLQYIDQDGNLDHDALRQHPQDEMEQAQQQARSIIETQRSLNKRLAHLITAYPS